MSLIEEALRQLEAKQSAAGGARKASVKPIPAPISIEPLPAATVTTSSAPVMTVPARTEDVPAGLHPWVGFLATLVASSVLLLVGLSVGAWWSTRGARMPFGAAGAPTAAGNQHEPPAVAPIKPMPKARSRPSLAKPKPPALHLSGIVEGVGQPLVIVNGHILRVGESLEGAVLLGVGENLARFRWRDEDLIIRTSQ